jgi:hypothetical protein
VRATPGETARMFGSMPRFAPVIRTVFISLKSSRLPSAARRVRGPIHRRYYSLPTKSPRRHPQCRAWITLLPRPADLAQSLTPMLVDPPGFAHQDLAAVHEKWRSSFHGTFQRDIEVGSPPTHSEQYASGAQCAARALRCNDGLVSWLRWYPKRDIR